MILLVHGIWNRGTCFGSLEQRLRERGVGLTSTIDLTPNDGSAAIETLARQVAERVDAIEGPVDLVGFSMGALVCRTYLALLGGARRVGTFVSLSGPHAGTATARPLGALGYAGARDMTPGSELLKRLQDVPLEGVRVHTLRTRHDLMILPSTSSRLPGVQDHEVPVVLHRWMLEDSRVASKVATWLLDGRRRP